jgi:hypothetical protein
LKAIYGAVETPNGKFFEPVVGNQTACSPLNIVAINGRIVGSYSCLAVNYKPIRSPAVDVLRYVIGLVC